METIEGGGALGPKALSPVGHFCPVQGQGHRAEGSPVGENLGGDWSRAEGRAPKCPLRAEQGLRAPPSPLLLKGSPGLTAPASPGTFLDPGQADGVGTCLLQDPRQFRYLVKFERPWPGSPLLGAISRGLGSRGWCKGRGARSITSCGKALDQGDTTIATSSCAWSPVPQSFLG